MPHLSTNILPYSYLRSNCLASIAYANSPDPPFIPRLRGRGLLADYVKGDKYKGLLELRVRFASDITRVFYFDYQNDSFVMLHGFKKKTNKTPSSELERALKYKLDFERRGTNE